MWTLMREITLAATMNTARTKRWSAVSAESITKPKCIASSATFKLGTVIKKANKMKKFTNHKSLDKWQV